MSKSTAAGRGVTSPILLQAKPEWTAMFDKMMLASGHHSNRAAFIDHIINEYAARRGFTLPPRLNGVSRYIHE